MFEDATFDSRGNLRQKSPQWMLSAVAINSLVLAALILRPLFYLDSLPIRLLSESLILPKPPVQLTPVVTRPHPQVTSSTTTWNPFQAPTKIPTIISSAPDMPPADAALQPSDASIGVSGADTLPSVFIHTTPPPEVRAAPTTRPNISAGVAAGMLLQKTLPTYPAIAKAMRLSGTVTLAATISASGSIENLHVLSGPIPLRESAITAVQAWRYHPYQLNHQPVAVETTISVIFSLTRN